MWHCLCDAKFSRFDTVPACDRQTHTHTHDHSMYHASITSHVNTSHCLVLKNCLIYFAVV